jgi:putative transposase
MEIDKELIYRLLSGYKGPEDLIGEQGLLKQLTKASVERAMPAELTHHLGYEKHEASGRLSGSSSGQLFAPMSDRCHNHLPSEFAKP